MRSVLRAAIAALCWGTALSAQARPLLRGTVLHADERTPAVSVLIEVIDATGGVAGRALTGQGGRFAIPLAPARAYTVRALRVGYRPSIAREVAVSDSGASIRIVLEDVPVRLNATRITTDDKCGVQADGGLIATAWEEVRKALASSDAAADRREFHANVTNWYSVHAPDGNSPIWQELTQRILDTPKPYAGANASEVEKLGYARPGPGGAVDYLGPDAETFASPIFAATHCFRLVPPQTGRPWLGIAFRPHLNRIGEAIVEIDGTFWVDTANAALRLIEYRYTNGPPSYARIGAGGRIELDRLSTGEWLIRRWTIRLAMDVFERRGTESPRATGAPFVAASGGFVTSLVADTVDLLAPAQRMWRATFTPADATARLEGATVEFATGGYFGVADSRGVASVADVPPGRFPVFASTALMRGLALPPLRITAEVGADGGNADIRVPGVLDLLKQRCGTVSESRRQSVVFGSLAGAGPLHPGGSAVAVAFIADALRETPLGQLWRADSMSLAAGQKVRDLGNEVIPDSFGRWIACGIARGSTVRVAAVDRDGKLSGATYLRVEDSDRVIEAGTLIGRSP